MLERFRFLPGIPSRGAWTLPDGASHDLTPIEYWLGNGEYALEVILASSDVRPSTPGVRDVWKRYQGYRPAPVLLIVAYPAGDKQVASVCGPIGQDPAVWEGIELGQVERLSKSALTAFDRNHAANLIQQALPELHSPLPGITNRGLFSTHDLITGVPIRSDWKDAVQLSIPLLERTGDDLIRGLGFDIETLTSSASVLRAAGSRRAVAVFLQDNELPEISSERFNRHSPITYALTMADNEGLPYAIVTRGNQIRLYCADIGRGVGRKGRTETYIELNLSLISEDVTGLLNLLFAPGALEPGGTVDQLLENSHRFATGIGRRLRDRIYVEAVPTIATALARKQSAVDSAPTSEQIDFYYEQAMLVLFRILFVAYAEDRDLLPYRTNGEYKDHSLQHRAERLAEQQFDPDNPNNEFASNQSNLWDEVNALWKAVDKGNSEWGVPPYNGGLFDDDPDVRPAGAALSRISLTNTEFGPALRAMIVDETDEETFGPVDFRSLSVREFGTIYEGLLESSLGFAETDLSVDKKGSYLPASEGQIVAVQAGEFYLHNSSGARKSSGSYFTKPFAVEHLLDHALTPALNDHLRRIELLLDTDDLVSASEKFFDFRCADISMGSGHFLIAAIDRIEREMANFLNIRPIVGVQKELESLRTSAVNNLRNSIGDIAESVEIENSSLLRRQIARRCIYGIDLNPISVELARLSVWIHTFVPGLPLSLLDRTLVHGDSLTGIGTAHELLEIFDVNPQELLAVHIQESLEQASEPLMRLARISEANIREIGEAREEHQLATDEASSVKDLMNLAVGVRVGRADKPAWIDLDQIHDAVGLDRAKTLVDELHSVHFPALFPEVFISERPGFDCIIGNPPWDKVKVEEHEFWGRHFPGHRSLRRAEQNSRVEQYRETRPELVRELETLQTLSDQYREIIRSGPFNLGSGDTDLYKVFAWRFWQLVADHGHIGVVLPRQVFALKGMSEWRKKVLTEGSVTDSTMLLNKKRWVFDELHPQYTVSLASLKKESDASGTVATRGPYDSMPEFRQGTSVSSTSFPVDQFMQWSDDLTFPLIPSGNAGKTYLKMRESPRLDSGDHGWSARPVREFETIEINEREKADSAWVSFESTTLHEPLPIYSGESFDLWNEDTGVRYAWSTQEPLIEFLQQKRVNGAKHARSAFHGLSKDVLEDPDTLSIMRPRISFRDITNRTNRRTVIASLIPPKVTITELSPYLLIDRDSKLEAFLLGVMTSIPFDWAARRVVEGHVKFFVLNSLPIPLPSDDSPQKAELQNLAGRLAAVDERYSDWAREVGVEYGSVISEDEKQDIIHRIDALVAYLYGLDEGDLEIIFETFHSGWDYEPRLEAVLSHFRSL